MGQKDKKILNDIKQALKRKQIKINIINASVRFEFLNFLLMYGFISGFEKTKSIITIFLKYDSNFISSLSDTVLSSKHHYSKKKYKKTTETNAFTIKYSVKNDKNFDIFAKFR